METSWLWSSCDLSREGTLPSHRFNDSLMTSTALRDSDGKCPRERYDHGFNAQHQANNSSASFSEDVDAAHRPPRNNDYYFINTDSWMCKKNYILIAVIGFTCFYYHALHCTAGAVDEPKVGNEWMGMKKLLCLERHGKRKDGRKKKSHRDPSPRTDRRATDVTCTEQKKKITT